MAALERLLDTEFYVVQHPALNESYLRAFTYELPTAVDVVVAGVFGLHGLPSVRPGGRPSARHGGRPSARRAEWGPIRATYPSDIRAVYGVANVEPTRRTDNRQAVAEFQSQRMDPKDLTAFFQQMVPNAPSNDSQVGRAFIL